MKISNILSSIFVFVIALIAWVAGAKLIKTLCFMLAPFPSYSTVFFDCLLLTLILYAIYELGFSKTAVVYTLSMDIIFSLGVLRNLLWGYGIISCIPFIILGFVASAYSIWVYGDAD